MWDVSEVDWLQVTALTLSYSDTTINQSVLLCKGDLSATTVLLTGNGTLQTVSFDVIDRILNADTVETQWYLTLVVSKTSSELEIGDTIDFRIDLYGDPEAEVSTFSNTGGVVGATEIISSAFMTPLVNVSDVSRLIRRR